MVSKFWQACWLSSCKSEVEVMPILGCLALGTLRFFRQLGFVALNRPVCMSSWRCACWRLNLEKLSSERHFPQRESYVYPWKTSPEWTISWKWETITVSAVSKSTFPINIQKISFRLLTSQPQNQVNTNKTRLLLLLRLAQAITQICLTLPVSLTTVLGFGLYFSTLGHS